MSVARTTEIAASSNKSFDDPLTDGVSRACETLDNGTGVWVNDQEAVVEDGKISSWKVRIKVTFVHK